jgi:hypothetical protein
LENPKEGDRFKDVRMDGKMNVTEMRWGNVDWIHEAEVG